MDLWESLEEKIDQIQNTESYDEGQLQMENNVYVLTSLIQVVEQTVGRLNQLTREAVQKQEALRRTQLLIGTICA